MAGPLPTVIRGVLNKGLAGYDIQGAADAVVSDVVESALVESGIPAVEVVGVTTAQFAVAVGEVATIPVIVIVIFALLTMRVLERAILFVPSKLPPFLGMDKIYDLAKYEFRFIDNLENALIAYTLGAISTLFSSMLSAFSFMLGIVAPDAAAPHSTPVPNHTGYATEAEIQKLNREIQATNARVTALDLLLQPNLVPSPLPIPGVTSNPLGTPQPTVIRVGVPQTVWDQIHYVEHKIVAHQTSITDLYARTDHLTLIATQLQTEFKNLTGEIHAVRAVSTSWQDVELQVENLGSLVTQFVDEVSAELGHAVNVQKQMLPLALLLEPGIKGLRNLRKLEDNICQCPRFANIPNELGTALSVLEFVENG